MCKTRTRCNDGLPFFYFYCVFREIWNFKSSRESDDITTLSFVQLSTCIYFLGFRNHLMLFREFEKWIPLEPVLGVVDNVVPLVTVNEQYGSNPDCNFHAFIASLASGRSCHQHLLISTVAGVKCLCGGRIRSPGTSSLVQLSILSGPSGSWNAIQRIRKLIPLKPVLRGVDIVVPFIIVNEQYESDPDCNFHSSIASFGSGRSYHQNLFISTVAGVKCLCGGRKKSPSTSSLVQLSIPSGLSGSLNVNRCFRKLNTA